MGKCESCAILVRDIRIPYTAPLQYACEKAEKHINRAFGRKLPRILETRLYKTSVDARKKPDIFFVCTVLVSLACPPESAAYAVGRDGQLALYREE
ncbi:MAG: hypothetical protein ACI3XM_10495, partial [Eubacteriales bacterium]